MLVELESLILEFEPAVRLRFRARRECGLGFVPCRQEPHHCMPVMPGWRILQELTRLLSDCAQHYCPVEQLCVSGLVQLFDSQVQHGAGAALLELANDP